MTPIEYVIKEGGKDGLLSIWHDRIVAEWDNDTTDILRLSAIDSVEVDGEWWTFWCKTRKHRWRVYAPAAHSELRVRLFPDTVPGD